MEFTFFSEYPPFTEGFKSHFILKIQSKINRETRINTANKPTTISAYLSQRWELKSPEIHIILKRESNSSSNTGHS